jgi:hypothetical protein
MLTQIGYAPVFLSIAVTLLTVFFFLRSIARSRLENPAKVGKRVMVVLFLWLLLQGAWGFSGFYRQYDQLPPNVFLYGIGPAFLSIFLFLLVKKWREGILKLDLESLTWLHVIRVPVEFGLLLLAHYKVVSNEMTFEGRNFDIISGLTAPLIAWLVFKKQKGGKKLLLAWNFVCLGLLLNIVITAILSAPFPFQKFGLEQPNIAVFYFPFVWLPTLIVPIVLFSHLASIAQLLAAKEKKD